MLYIFIIFLNDDFYVFLNDNFYVFLNDDFYVFLNYLFTSLHEQSSS